jgi:hypothetical protein
MQEKSVENQPEQRDCNESHERSGTAERSGTFEVGLWVEKMF